MIYGILTGLIIGVILGWFGTFVCWSISKRNLRWGWLLCQPWPLSKNKQSELAGYYQ